MDQPISPSSAATARRATLAGWLGILLVAAAVRLPAVAAGLPYFAYVDEGHVLHHVAYLLQKRTWEPDTYSYPSLPFYLVVAEALAYAPAYEVIHGESLRADLSPIPHPYYDWFYPADLLLLARLLTVAFSLGVVALTGMLASRVAGPAAGLAAGWLAALVPALVTRSAVVNVNPQATFFAVAALVAAERARRGAHPWRDAAWAGAFAGLAGVSKYPAALVALPVALAVLLAPLPWRRRLGALAVAGAAAAGMALLLMPALWLRPAHVIAGLEGMRDTYGSQAFGGGYWHQTVVRAEEDIPFEGPELGWTLVALTALGAAVGLADRRFRPAVAGWLLFAAATVTTFAPYAFRAFRNFLPIVPLACVLPALAYARARERPRARRVADAIAFALPLLLFAPQVASFARVRAAQEDSRHLAMRWLADHVRPRDRVLVAQELVVLPGDLALLRAPTEVEPWEVIRQRAATDDGAALGQFTFVVAGGHSTSRANRQLMRRAYRRVYKTGSRIALDDPFIGRGNDQIVTVFQRRPERRRQRPTDAPERRQRPAAATTRDAGALSTERSRAGLPSN